jgi:hypothetical protein
MSRGQKEKQRSKNLASGDEILEEDDSFLEENYLIKNTNKQIILAIYRRVMKEQSNDQ